METLFDPAQQILSKAEIYNHAALMPTIEQRIEYALSEGMILTQADANRWPFCTSRLGAFIHKLRKKGLPIRTNDIKVVCADGHTAIVAQYEWDKTRGNESKGEANGSETE